MINPIESRRQGRPRWCNFESGPYHDYAGYYFHVLTDRFIGLSRLIPKREWKSFGDGACCVDKKWEDKDGVVWGVNLWENGIVRPYRGLFQREFGEEVLRIEVEDFGSVGRRLTCERYRAGNWPRYQWSVGDGDPNDVVWSNYWDKMLKLDNFRDEFQKALKLRGENV